VLLAKYQLRLQVNFFHLGLFFKSSVQIYKLKNGQAWGMDYDLAVFNYGKIGLNVGHMPKDFGFA